ncbi:hypothetical protein ScPMuIL_016976 [Solemya velum]
METTRRIIPEYLEMRLPRTLMPGSDTEGYPMARPTCTSVSCRWYIPLICGFSQLKCVFDHTGSLVLHRRNSGHRSSSGYGFSTQAQDSKQVVRSSRESNDTLKGYHCNTAALARSNIKFIIQPLREYALLPESLQLVSTIPMRMSSVNAHVMW